MPARIRARYADGVLTPLDPVDLQEGVEVALAIDTAQPETPGPPDADPSISESETQPPPPEREPQDRVWAVARIKQQRAMPDNARDKIPTGLAHVATKFKQFEQRQQEPPPDGEPQGLAAIVAMADELNRQMPHAWDDFPTDFAKNKKHYLYGHPKEEDE